MLIDIPTKGALEECVRKGMNEGLSKMAMKILELERVIKVLEESVGVLMREKDRNVELSKIGRGKK